eukprot:m.253201 g.253201  ORF g.253201 m.253201 type:complete len:341 (+) comp17532_c1_seq2:155-1177(+)
MFQAAHIIMVLYNLELDAEQQKIQTVQSLAVLKKHHIDPHVRRKGKTLALVGTHKDLVSVVEARTSARRAQAFAEAHAKSISVFGVVSSHSGDGVVDVFKDAVLKSLGGVKRVTTIDGLSWSRPLQAPTLEGVFVKRGAKRKNWKIRRFRLTPGTLTYHSTKDSPMSDIRGTIHRSDIQKVEVGIPPPNGPQPPKDFPYHFTMFTTERTYYCSFASEEEREPWVAAFAQHSIETKPRSATTPSRPSSFSESQLGALHPHPTETMQELDPETAQDLQGERRNTIDSARLSISSGSSSRHGGCAPSVEHAGPISSSALSLGSQAMVQQLTEQDQAVSLDDES